MSISMPKPRVSPGSSLTRYSRSPSAFLRARMWPALLIVHVLWAPSSSARKIGVVLAPRFQGVESLGFKLIVGVRPAHDRQKLGGSLGGIVDEFSKTAALQPRLSSIVAFSSEWMRVQNEGNRL